MTDTKVIINWTYDGNSHDGFKLLRSTDGGSTWPVTIDISEPTDRTYEDNDILLGETYHYKLAAYKGETTGNYSDPVQVTITINVNTLTFTVTAQPDTKEFDGNTDSSKSPIVVGKFYKGDSGTFSQHFDSPKISEYANITPTSSINNISEKEYDCEFIDAEGEITWDRGNSTDIIVVPTDLNMLLGEGDPEVGIGNEFRMTYGTKFVAFSTATVEESEVTYMLTSSNAIDWGIGYELDKEIYPQQVLFTGPHGFIMTYGYDENGIFIYYLIGENGNDSDFDTIDYDGNVSDLIYTSDGWVGCGTNKSIINVNNNFVSAVYQVNNDAGNNDRLNGVVYVGGKYYVASEDNDVNIIDPFHSQGIYVSTDLQSWSTITVDGVNPGEFPALRGIAYGDGKIVAVGQAGTVITSSNGTDWKMLSLPDLISMPDNENFKLPLESISWNSENSYFIITNGYGYVYKTSDLESFELIGTYDGMFQNFEQSNYFSNIDKTVIYGAPGGS